MTISNIMPTLLQCKVPEADAQEPACDEHRGAGRDGRVLRMVVPSVSADLLFRSSINHTDYNISSNSNHANANANANANYDKHIFRFPFCRCAVALVLSWFPLPVLPL